MWVPTPTDWFVDQIIWERMCRLQRQVLVHACLYYVFDQPKWTDGDYEAKTKELLALVQQHPALLPLTPFPEIFGDPSFVDTLYDKANHPWAIKTARTLLYGFARRYESEEERDAEDIRRGRSPLSRPESIAVETANWWTK
jgi:hypothetical protein